MGPSSFNQNEFDDFPELQLEMAKIQHGVGLRPRKQKSNLSIEILKNLIIQS